MEALIKRIKNHESLSLEVYKDRDKWAIGYGHQCDKDHPPITQHEAEDYLLKDIHRASDQFMKWKRNNCSGIGLIRSEVIVELIYWVGFNGFLKFERMIFALRDYDFHLAALELYNSNLGKDPELRGRARELAELMWDGTYG